jgi:hypothetical protein
MTRIVVTLALAVLVLIGECVRCLGQEGRTQETVTRSQEQPSERLLVDAYIAGMNLAPQDRAFLLATLSSAAAKIQPSFCRLWTEELFKLSFKLPVSWNRIVYEKNAVVSLSAVDPLRAFEMFGQIEAPVPMRSGALPEDVRADAANTVFFNYWNSRGIAALADIRSEAERVGESGQYPYVAIAPILVEVGKRKDDYRNAAILLFSDALTFYARGSKFGTEDDNFLAFLDEVWTVIPGNLLQQALAIAVKHLLQNLRLPAGEAFSGQVNSKNGMAQFGSPAEQNLYELLPKIREIDPAWAKELIEGNPFLSQAGAGTGKSSSSGSVIIHFNASETPGDELPSIKNQADETARFNAAISAAAGNPDEALRIASGLSVGPKLQVYAQVAAELASSHPELSARLTREVQNNLDSIPGEATKFHTLVNLASAVAAAHDSKGFVEIFARVFRLGEELFEEDLQSHPGKLVQQTDSFEGLNKLTQLGIKVNSTVTLSRVEKVENDALRANLLAIAASALYEGALGDENTGGATVGSNVPAGVSR